MTTQYAPSVSATPKRRRRLLQRRQFQGFLFVVPAVVFTLIFFIFPLIMTGWMSFNDWPLLGTPKFIGLENFTDLVDDRHFGSSLWFTTKYTLLVVPPTLLLGMLLALLVNQPLTGIGLFRTTYFIPVVVGFAASSYIWVWLFHNEAGLINTVLRDLGLLKGDLLWMAKPNLALTGIIVSVVWKTVGFSMILFMAGIQAIPREHKNPMATPSCMCFLLDMLPGLLGFS
ncbi:MAG: sugar ABC transporter permease [Chloroflexota bacterium]